MIDAGFITSSNRLLRLFVVLVAISWLHLACAKHVEFKKDDSSVSVVSYNLLRQITIVSPLGESEVLLSVPVGYTPTDELFICFGAEGQVEVINSAAEIMSSELLTGHTLSVKLPLDAQGYPDAERYMTPPCFEFYFYTESIYPSSEGVEFAKRTTIVRPFL